MVPSNAAALATAYGQFAWPGAGLPWFPHPSQTSPSAGGGAMPANFAVDLLAGSKSVQMEDKQSCSASMLPGIHEVFSQSRRGSNIATLSNSRLSRSPGTATSAANQKLPSFANFMPVHQVKHPLPDLAQLSSMLHSPPAVGGSAPSSVPPTLFQSSSNTLLNPGGGGINPSNPTQRPTAQLPPIAHTMRQTKDRAGVQHSITIAGFPSLDDVLSYYVSQGRLFKCAHCNILFFERGMYFLHASLHGLSSPWECSICHKVCADKNEFTLHFVNQQHNNL